MNGIEIGASSQNPFGLVGKCGAYANVDFDASQGGMWQEDSIDPAIVNLVVSGVLKVV